MLLPDSVPVQIYTGSCPSCSPFQAPSQQAHTACSGFGPLCYGGLCLPDLYMDQSYGQLKLLLGHLGMKDENGILILFAISHLQLHTGSATLFFELPFL